MATDDSRTLTKRFAAYITQAARAAGYDIDSPRGGGKTQLARDTGMSASSVGRMLAGQTMPDPSYYEPLARTLRVPLRELLIRSGIVSPESLGAPAPATVRSRGITPVEAAEELGIRDPVDRELFLAMVDRLRRRHRAAHEGEAGEEAVQG